MKKLVKILLLLCTMLCLGVALVGCGNEPGCKHELEVSKQPTLTETSWATCHLCSENVFEFPKLNSTDYEVNDTNPDYITYTYTKDNETYKFSLSNFEVEYLSEKETMTEDWVTITGYTGNSTSIVIPNTMIVGTEFGLSELSVDGIGAEAFKDKATITSITLPDGLKEIGDYAFANTGLTEFVIPNSVSKIGVGTFAGCNSLQKLSTPMARPTGASDHLDISIFRLGTLFGYTDSNSVVPASLKEVAITKHSLYGGEFLNCQNLEKVVLEGEYINYIGGSAFYGCTSLKEVILGSTITRIYQAAFQDCSSIEELVIPASLTTIDNYVFNGCTSLNTIYYMGTKTQWNNVSLTTSSENNAPLIDADIYYYSETQPTAVDYFNNDRVLNMWHYDNNNDKELWQINFTTNVDNKTFVYSHSEVDMSDEYWAMLKQAEAQDMLGDLFDNDQTQIEMVTSSATKSEYETKFATWYASLAVTTTEISFADNKILLNGSATQINYIEIDNEIYNDTTEKLVFTFDITNNTIFDEMVTDYYTVRHIYSIEE